eukprot:6258938-Alexandrium_andersonii.AAC.1
MRASRQLVDGLPEVAKKLMVSGWEGGSFIAISCTPSGLMAPNAQDVNNAHLFLKPFVSAYPHKIPSGYMIADVLLQANESLSNRLLIPRGPGQTVSELALQEGGKIKKLLGHLRYLFRGAAKSKFP